MHRAVALEEASLQDAFVRDHSRLENLLGEALGAVQAADFALSRERFARFARGLRRHALVEDTVLFPAFEQHTGMFDSGPTMIMRREH